MNFKGLKIVMTGAGSGFGLALTQRLLDAGAEIFAVSRTADTMKLEHPSLRKFPADLSTKEGIDQSFEAALKAMGDIDFYFANSGFGYHEKLTADWDKIDMIFKLNVYSPYYALGKMIELKGDKPFHFAVTASGISYIGMPGMALYSGTKAAVHRFAESVRYELNKSQKIHLIYPTAMKTPFFSQENGEPVPSMQQDVNVAAARTIKGLKRNKPSIFPSSMVAFGFLPSIWNEAAAHLIRRKEAKRFHRWIEGGRQ